MEEKKKRGRPAKRMQPLDPQICYCRKCQKSLPATSFYKATDETLDTNGRMSVCKDCINAIFEGRFKATLSVNRAVLEVCRILNVAYDEAAISSALAHAETKVSNGADENESMKAFFGTYKAKLAKRNVPPYFIEPEKYTASPDVLNDAQHDEEFKKYLQNFWGIGLTFEQYSFLESELARWKRTHSCSNAAEETLLREICFTQLEIREARQATKSPDAAIKRLQELMKTAAVDPAKANAAGSGRMSETFGEWIKQIEETEPAELYQDKTLFEDVDGLKQYFQDYVVRPLRNFVLGSRDFNVQDVNAEEEAEDDVLEEDVEV